MIIYTPENMIPERIEEAKKILDSLPYRHCFITGSFLFKKSYKDIDVFAVTRGKEIRDRRIKLSIIDFNDLHSLFYHSISKSCIAKDILPKKRLRVTIADYWSIINETIPALLNERKNFHKAIRSLVLYTEYLKNKRILDSFELTSEVNKFKNYNEVLDYTRVDVPIAVRQRVKKGYIQRYFYTQAAFHKQNIKYEGQKYLYEVSHAIVQEA